jgi:hypothetical protein
MLKSSIQPRFNPNPNPKVLRSIYNTTLERVTLQQLPRRSRILWSILGAGWGELEATQDSNPNPTFCILWEK